MTNTNLVQLCLTIIGNAQTHLTAEQLKALSLDYPCAELYRREGEAIWFGKDTTHDHHLDIKIPTIEITLAATALLSKEWAKLTRMVKGLPSALPIKKSK